MYRVAARLGDAQAQAVAERYASFGHSNLEEFWTLLWRDPSLKAAAMDDAAARPITSRTRVSIYTRTSWDRRRHRDRLQSRAAGGASRRRAARHAARVEAR